MKGEQWLQVKKLIRCIYYPVSYVCDGEGSVVTNILAAGLFGVAVEIFLFVSPRWLGCSPEHQDTEDKQDGQPHLWSKKTRNQTLRNNTMDI